MTLSIIEFNLNIWCCVYSAWLPSLGALLGVKTKVTAGQGNVKRTGRRKEDVPPESPRGILIFHITVQKYTIEEDL